MQIESSNLKLSSQKPLPAVVESAAILDSSEKQRLEKLLTKKFATYLNIKYKTKQSLIGGFKVTVGDWIVDGTVKRMLDQLHTHIAEKIV